MSLVGKPIEEGLKVMSAVGQKEKNRRKRGCSADEV